MANNNGYDSDDLVVDRKAWEICFQELLEKSPEYAERLARILFWLRDAIRSGPEGIVEANHSLTEGIEFAYLYTAAHRAAFELFLLYVEGYLEIADELKRLIAEAVARGNVIAKRFKKREGRKKGKN